MARPTELRRTVLAQAIQKLRQDLGDTQQQFAQRLGVSVVTIAKYETNSRPAKAMLAQMVAIAEQSGLKDDAALLTFIQDVGKPVDLAHRRRLLLTGAVFAFLENPDEPRYRQLEIILEKELRPLRKQDEEANGPFTQPSSEKVRIAGPTKRRT